MSRYEAAKRSLFVDLAPTNAVINIDSPTGARFVAAAKSERVWRIGRHPTCDVCPVHVELNAQGIRGKLSVDNLVVNLDTRLIGEHNLENVLLAVGILQSLKVDLQIAVAGLAGDFAVPG